MLMNSEDKLNEDEVLFDDLHNYRLQGRTLVERTAKKAQQLIKSVLSEGHIDGTTATDSSPLRRLIHRESKCFSVFAH